MLTKDTYTLEHLSEIIKKYSIDPSILERSIYALGLVEALVRSGADFVFKGGTSLMLLLDRPLRLSTDIDIVVAPDYDVDKYIDESAKLYPFIRKDEDIRKGSNNVIKKHYKFFYNSPFQKGKEIPILLDVLFEKNNYPDIQEKEIKTLFTLNDNNQIKVKLPTVDSIIGDKLTAFAPNTCGIKYVSTNKNDKIVDKKIEVIKQFFDIACLFDKVENFETIKKSYVNNAETEIAYRNLNLTYEDCLEDTFNCCLAIFSRGKLFKDDYKNLLEGIQKIGSYLINFRFNGEEAYKQAANVMLLSSCLLSDSDYIKKDTFEEISIPAEYDKFKFMKKLDEYNYNKACFAINLFKKYKNK